MACGKQERIKDEKIGNRINWIHSLMKKQNNLPPDWELTQCLFGEHLLKDNPGKPVALVESEKTAIISSAVLPQYVWLATGGKSQLNSRLEVLKGRQIIAFPDIDGYKDWNEKLSSLKGYTIKISYYLETIATDELRTSHIDLADILINEIRASKITAVPLSHPTGTGTIGTDRDTQSPFTNPNFLQISKYISENAIGSVAALIADLDLIPTDVWQDCPTCPNCPI